jgi:hypothetical protein
VRGWERERREDGVGGREGGREGGRGREEGELVGGGGPSQKRKEGE